MGLLGLPVAGLGGLLSLIGLVWIIIIAFQKGDVLWGVLSIFCGIVAIVYGAQNMPATKTPLYLLLGGIVLSVIGNFLGFSTTGGNGP